MLSRIVQGVVVVLVVSPSIVLAQSVGPAEPPVESAAKQERSAVQLQLSNDFTQSPAQLDLASDYRTGTNMRNTGIGLTSAGAVLLPVSFYLMFRHGIFPCGWYGDNCTAQERSDIDRDYNIAMGTLIGSAVTLGVGIPLWAVGVHRMRQAQRMGYQPVSLTPVINPTPGGVIAGVQLVTF